MSEDSRRGPDADPGDGADPDGDSAPRARSGSRANRGDGADAEGQAADRPAPVDRPPRRPVAAAVLPGAVRRSYAAKLAVGFALVVLLIAAVGVASYVQIQDITREDATRSLRSTAALQADSLSEWVASMTAETRGVATSAVYGSGDETRIRGHLRRSYQLAGPHVVGMHYVDPSTGEIVVSTERSYEGRTIRDVDPRWTEPVDEATTAEEWGVAVADRASERGNRSTLAFAAEVQLGVVVVVGETRQEYEQLNGTGAIVDTRVLNVDGRSVFDADDGADPLAATPEFAAARGGAPQVAEYDREVAAFAPIEGVDWVVVTAAPTSELYAASETVGRNVVVLVGSALIALSLVGAAVGYGTVTSLGRLRRRAEAMEAGNLDVDFRTYREDEIGRLFDAFAGMRDALREQIREAEAARERAEASREELERQNERLDQFASTVSHDLRNPLTIANGHLELLSRGIDRLADGDDVDPDDLRESLRKVDESHERIEAIVDDVLTLARQGQDVSDRTAVDLEAIAREAWSNVDSGSHGASDRSVDATLRVVGDATIEADRDRLLRAFENLFRNSVEHSSTSSRTGSDDAVEHGSTSPRSTPSREDAVDHGSTGADAQGPGTDGEGRRSVTVEVGPTDDGFYVADDGPGLPDGAADDIFEYGYTTDESGTGLGLAIVQTVVTAHGWEIAVDADYDGGAKFVVSGVETASRPEIE